MGPVTSTPRLFFFFYLYQEKGSNPLPCPFWKVAACLSKGCVSHLSISWCINVSRAPAYELYLVIWCLEYYILACVPDCLTSDKLGMPEPRPTYSSRVSWHCLPWSVIISNEVVSELVSENQAYESPSWSTLSGERTECNISCIDFAFLIKSHCASWKCVSLYDDGLSQEHPLENINLLFNKRRL